MLLAGRTRCACHMSLAPRSLRTATVLAGSPGCGSHCHDVPPHVSAQRLRGSQHFPLTPQGNCFVWNLTGGIGDEVTQLIPKTKIPAHTRYALQCRFSPDSTCVQGLGCREPSPGCGEEGACLGRGGANALGPTWWMARGCGMEGLLMTPLPHSHLPPGSLPPARLTRRARSGGRPTSP